MEKEEQQKFYHSLVFPTILMIILWLVKITEVVFKTSFADYGLLPQTWIGLRGIIFSPFLHANFAHLSANSLPLFFLTAGLFYYYGKKATSIFILSLLITGFWVLIFAKDTWVHIGASGVVYALATFHFTSGVLRREPRMMAFSLLVVFLYGSLVWGIIHDFSPDKNISWQSHMLGGLAGIILAFAYRQDGPQRIIYQWEDDEDEDNQEYEDLEDQPGQESGEQSESHLETKTTQSTGPQTGVNYIYKEKE